MKKPLIPFGVLPGHWGLKGKTRDRAKAEYELEGYDLDCRLCEIDNDEELDRAQCRLKIDLKYKKITEYQYRKLYANLLELPWWEVVSGRLVIHSDGESIEWDMDWNEYFIQKLRKEGWQGGTDEELVDAWFQEVSMQMVMSNFDDPEDFLNHQEYRVVKERSQNNMTRYS